METRAMMEEGVDSYAWILSVGLADGGGDWIQSRDALDNLHPQSSFDTWRPVEGPTEGALQWGLDPVDVAGGDQRSLDSGESLSPSTPSSRLSTMPQSAITESNGEPSPPEVAVFSPSSSDVSWDEDYMANPPDFTHYPVTLYRPPPTPTGAKSGYSDAQRQAQSLVLRPTRISRLEVGSERWTRASQDHRKTTPKFFCRVEGCKSKGFTAKHNYDCES
ncbi:hypothetical protein AAF712_010483 [Marasmius tenuissimus]|uniref:Uncharacterized protein n=1 Tax=Marasmius tenuissimus TaxID=585030 RepID=A0ABR2ZLT4_9AGAR